MNLLYIGDVPITPQQSGGSIVLWRHQQLWRTGSINSADTRLGFSPRLGEKIWLLLRKFRLNRLGLILQPWLRQLDLKIKTCDAIILKQQIDGVITVAHGLAWLQAMAVAKATNLPLITIVHDWYPDASGCPRWCLWIWEQKFRQLMRQSDLILAVSVEMAREIGPHPNLKVLPPIPDPGLKPCPPRHTHPGPWRLYYSGLCGGLYRPLLQQLIDAVKGDQRFALHLSGLGNEDLSLPEGQQRLRTSGFLNGDTWQQSFDEADALVLVLSFEHRHRRHLATHFPSKLVEYANRRRPVLIWGPRWSSAIKWGMSQGSMFCFTEENPHIFLEQINIWLPKQPAKSPRLAHFSARSISKIFESEISACMNRRKNLITRVR